LEKINVQYKKKENKVRMTLFLSIIEIIISELDSKGSRRIFEKFFLSDEASLAYVSEQFPVAT
jgi:hypothetical protein